MLDEHLDGQGVVLLYRHCHRCSTPVSLGVHVGSVLNAKKYTVQSIKRDNLEATLLDLKEVLLSMSTR